jgi:hypothetical protein
MADKAVFCIANSEGQARSIVEAAREAGFSSDDVSALFPDRGGSRGGVLGGVGGWLVGIGTLAIPGLGPFVAAGPIMAALGGAAAGAAAGGLTGGLVGLGMPEYEAKRYEGKIKSGGILISIHTDNGDEVTRAKELFKRAGAEDISYTGETKAA